jgi:hypothetical protein
MNDDELLTAVREQRTKVPMTVSVEQVISRGRALRARRRFVPGAAGALAAMAGAAVAVTALVPASHQPTARLAAWTVTELTHGNISVTIRELKDPAGLQRQLRKDGVPASVSFVPQQNPACKAYPGGTSGHFATPLLIRVFPVPYGGLPRNELGGKAQSVPVSRPAHGSNNLNLQHSVAIVIHPAALPGNVGVQIAVSQGGGTSAVVLPIVVYASPACTGS